MLTPADIAAVTGNNNDGFGGGNGAWWLIVLFLFAFAGNGWGNGFGGGGNGAANNYVLASDFATIQRQLSDGFNSIDNALDRQNSGICDLGYTQAQLINGVQISGMQNANAIQSQIAQCCCDVREGISGVNYNMAMNTNGITKAISDGFCQTNFNNANNTRDILDAIKQLQNDAKDEKIASLTAMVSDLRGQASQNAQTSILLNALNPSPNPAYIVPNPNAVYGCGCGCGCGTN